MRIAIVTTDVREDRRDYARPVASFGTAPAALLQGFTRFPEVEVHVLSCARQLMRSQEKLAENMWFHSLHVPKLGWMRTAYQGCIRAVRRKLREIQPDIVHGQGTELDCALDAVFSGFPNVITIHGNMRLMARLGPAKPLSFLWLAARLERLTLPRAQGVICITHYTKEAVSGLARRSWVVPNAVDASFFSVEPQAIPAARAQILCVGVVSPRKNQNAFIRALDRLAEKCDLEVLFIGDGPAKDPYVVEFNRLVNARPWCIHGGFVGPEQLRKHLSQATLLALPSIEDNCPMTVLEAMAAGVPVVASRVGGLPDLIEQDYTGIFCDPLKASSMAAAVRTVLENPSPAREMGKRAKTRAMERFHPEVIARKHLQIYREVLTNDS